MIKHAVVVGVDASQGAERAAVMAEEIASLAHAKCVPVHATRDVWGALKVAARRAVKPEVSALTSISELNESVVATATRKMRDFLAANLSEETRNQLRVLIGPSGVILQRVAREVDASLIVIGQKDHSAIGRAFGTSTAELLLHEVGVPVFVGSPPKPTFKRVLVAVDFSDGAAGTIAWAEHMARLFGAKLRVLHVVELLPAEETHPVGLSQEGFFELCGETFEKSIWSYVTLTDAEPSTRQGHAFETILDEVEQWKADMLVVASHGKGMIESVLLGSTTRRLVAESHLPMLIVPPKAWSSARAELDREEAASSAA